MKLSGVSKGDNIHKMYVSDFFIYDLRSGQSHNLPIISQWDKFQLHLNATRSTQYIQDHGVAGPWSRHLKPRATTLKFKLTVSTLQFRYLSKPFRDPVLWLNQWASWPQTIPAGHEPLTILGQHAVAPARSPGPRSLADAATAQPVPSPP